MKADGEEEARVREEKACQPWHLKRGGAGQEVEFRGDSSRRLTKMYAVPILLGLSIRDRTQDLIW